MSKSTVTRWHCLLFNPLILVVNLFFRSRRRGRGIPYSRIRMGWDETQCAGVAATQRISTDYFPMEEICLFTICFLCIGIAELQRANNPTIAGTRRAKLFQTRRNPRDFNNHSNIAWGKGHWCLQKKFWIVSSWIENGRYANEDDESLMKWHVVVLHTGAGLSEKFGADLYYLTIKASGEGNNRIVWWV